jgi:arabinofuranosyltransferase
LRPRVECAVRAQKSNLVCGSQTTFALAHVRARGRRDRHTTSHRCRDASVRAAHIEPSARGGTLVWVRAMARPRQRVASPARAAPAAAVEEVAPVSVAAARVDEMADPLARRAHVALAAVVVALLVLAWLHRNIVDDAFIMFRYADQLTRGAGLVWNPGERVEGYTNFLGTLAFAAGLAAGFEPIAFSHAFNLVFLAAALILFWAVARRVLSSSWHALAATALLGTNFTFSSSGTQGLGTHMQTAALLGCTLLLVQLRERASIARLVALSLLGAAAVLVRMDSLLPVALLAGVAVAFVYRTPARLLALVLPGAIVLATWLAWRWSYYGDLLPNTFYVKVASVGTTVAGLYYLYLFFLSYLLFPHLVVIGAALRRVRLPDDWAIALACAIVVTWCAYIVRIGGDFIEFRFMAPVLPFLFLAIYWSVLRVVPDGALRWGLLGLVALGTVNHQVAFERLHAGSPVLRPSLKVVSVPDPAQEPPILWSEYETGHFLGEAFDHDPDVKLAIGAAGVIPFYSRLGFVDILGLNDAWVARHGTPITFERFVGNIWPAHVRLATLDYLLERRVNLFVGAGSLLREDLAATVPTLGDLLTAMLGGEADIARALGVRPGQIPAGTRVVEIPVRRGYRLIALYLTPSPRVDAVIAANGWRTYPVASLAGA